MELITTELLQALCRDENIIITQHTAYRIRERGIKYQDIKKCILDGEIIEQYTDDYPYPSCLIMSRIADNKHLHTVVGTNGDIICVITAYYPDSDKWESDFKTRKGNK